MLGFTVMVKRKHTGTSQTSCPGAREEALTFPSAQQTLAESHACQLRVGAGDSDTDSSPRSLFSVALWSTRDKDMSTSIGHTHDGKQLKSPGETLRSIPKERLLELRFQLPFALMTNVEEFHREPKEGL